MSEHVLAIVASNLALAVILALVAWTVQARARRPWLAHLLWLLVLVKLVTPPLISAPVITIPAPTPLAATSASDGESFVDAVTAIARTTEADEVLGSAAPVHEPPAATTVPYATTLFAWPWLLGLGAKEGIITRFRMAIERAGSDQEESGERQERERARQRDGRGSRERDETVERDLTGQK